MMRPFILFLLALPLLAAGDMDAFQTKVTHLAPAPETSGPGGGTDA